MPPDGHKSVTVHERTYNDLSELAGENESLGRVVRRLVEFRHEMGEAPHPWRAIDELEDRIDRIPERTADAVEGRLRG